MVNKSTVIHIGHSKTGSSALQTFFARNIDLLEEYGVAYPSDPSMGSAKKGRISSGNLQSFFDTSEIGKKRMLFSSELFFQKFKKGEEFLDKLVENKEHVKIICFTRDLFDHFFSSYGQWVKRGGGTSGTLEFSEIYRTYNILPDVIKFCNAEGIDVEVKNYSRCSDSLEASFMEYLLGDQASSFMERSSNVDFKVNRSLTSSEAILQRSFNKYFGRKSCRMISDSLVNGLPDLKVDLPRICSDTISRVLKDNSESVAETNKHLAAAEHIRIETPVPFSGDGESDQEDCTLSHVQLDTVVSSIHKNIASSFSAGVTGEDVNAIRDIALKIEAEGTAGLEDALALMKIAQRGRPGGTVIKNKIEQWENLCKAKANEESTQSRNAA